MCNFKMTSLTLRSRPACGCFQAICSCVAVSACARATCAATVLRTLRAPLPTFSATAQISPSIGLDAQYSNYGIRTAPRNDTLRIENVAQSLVLSPRFQFTLFEAPANLFVSYSLQDVNDQSILGGAINRNTTHTLLASWSQSFQSPLTLATTLLYNNASVGGTNISILSLTETAGYSFLEDRLSMSLTGGINIVNSSGSDTQLTGNLSASYSFGAYGTLSLNLSAKTLTTQRRPHQPSASFKGFYNTPSDYSNVNRLAS